MSARAAGPVTSPPPTFVLTGATGRTGNAIAHALAGRSDLRLVACVAPSLGSAEPSRAIPAGIPGHARLDEVICDHQHAPDVLLDLTHAAPARAHATQALDAGMHVVVGATGLSDDELAHLGNHAASVDRSLLYVPNFSIGAVLLMQLAAQVVRYMPDVEIVELHHADKRDAPSGTARRTASVIAAARATGAGDAVGVAAGDAASRGEQVAGIPVHAVRLPGAVAHQEALFGASGELLTIRHDVLDRAAYAEGAARAIRGVGTLGPGGHTGLEQVL